MRSAFDEAARGLATVIADATDADVALGVPGSRDAEPAIDVHLLAAHLGNRERHRGLHRLPVELDHLVAINASGEHVAGLMHDVLAAIESSAHHQLSPDDVPIDWWLAFGTSPRPAVRVRTAVHLDRAIDEAPVTELIIVEPQFHRADLDAIIEREA